MKKLFLLSMALCLIFAMFGCHQDSNQSGQLPSSSSTQPSSSNTGTTASSTVTYPYISFHSPSVVLAKEDVTLSCSYSVCYVDVNRIRLCIYVEYLGEPMDYTGCSLGWWGPAWLVQEDAEESYILECELLAYSDDAVEIQIEQGFETEYSYYFNLPEDAPTGNYTVRFYVFGQIFEF